MVDVLVARVHVLYDELFGQRQIVLTCPELRQRVYCVARLLATLWTVEADLPKQDLRPLISYYGIEPFYHYIDCTTIADLLAAIIFQVDELLVRIRCRFTFELCPCVRSYCKERHHWHPVGVMSIITITATEHKATFMAAKSNMRWQSVVQRSESGFQDRYWYRIVLYISRRAHRDCRPN